MIDVETERSTSQFKLTKEQRRKFKARCAERGFSMQKAIEACVEAFTRSPDTILNLNYDETFESAEARSSHV
jgi:hypothetical protein